MISEEQLDMLIERLVRRVEQQNVLFLRKIGQNIKKIKNLSYSDAHKLVQMLQYGSDYDDLVNELSKLTSLNIEDIDEIFSNYAKKDLNFAKNFYEYRNIPFVPFNQNEALKQQTMALANIVKTEMYDYFRNNVLGYTITDEKGNIIFKGLKEIYNQVLDDALLNVSMGKETFDSAMFGILKDIGTSGLKTINYASGRSMRLDSALRMHLNSRISELHNEIQQIIGKELNTDGVEISVHGNPAPDHQYAQGKQFSNEEFDKLQSGSAAKDYIGKYVTLNHDHKNSYRPISELNCRHYIFSIILGVDEPQYNEEQLKEIIENNNKGFELYDKRSGKYKHYTNYEGTQLMRNLERKIREQKDMQILGVSSNNRDLIDESQKNITKLTKQYNEISKISGLPTKMDRLRVAGFKRKKVNNV